MLPKIARVALPVPLNKSFDYLLSPGQFPIIGGRVRVPFGPHTKIGVVLELVQESEFEISKLKHVMQILDSEPVWPKPLFELLQWCSQFYQYPLGDTLANAMPTALRKGKEAQLTSIEEWSITESGKDKLNVGLKNAIQQEKILRLLNEGPLVDSLLKEEDVSSASLKAVLEKGWVDKQSYLPKRVTWPEEVEQNVAKPNLNQEQAIAVATINTQQGFACSLLDGVTGSGKTEVYLNIIKPVLEKGKQALVLVPEIGLTPQTINRFRRRFNVPVAVIHSGLNETERVNAWLEARDRHAGIIIGTRSALLTPFDDLGIIIVDEEHDASYKQQDSLRYHARDVAIMRAHKEQIPIVLGSATPALESLQNAISGKYHHLILSSRAGNANAATHKVLDIKGQYLESGLSAPMIAEMRKHLQAGNQVMLFLNRRGFSPALLCHDCGWIAECARCDAYYTYHQNSNEMRCHHCGSQRPTVHQCKDCGSNQLVTMGVGTEQLEKHLEALFPEFKTIRIDRDSTRRKGSLEKALIDIRNGKHQILIGTQMLAKGHHFPDVTLVGLLDVDSSLYSSDFRASERLAQLFIQVAGRAGRASKPGTVLLQTHHPDHSLLQALLHKGYHFFAETALQERKVASLPPFAHLTLYRSEGNNSDMVETFLRQVRHILESHPLFDDMCMVLGPTPAPMAKRAGKFRWQLLLQASHRSTMQKLLASAKPAIEVLPYANRVRWSIDVEPQDLG